MDYIYRFLGEKVEYSGIEEQKSNTETLNNAEMKSALVDAFAKLENLNVLVIGDIILDQYVFVDMKGRAIKDPIPSTEYMHHETYAGGILAIANHLSNFVKKVTVVTLTGDTRTKLDFIKNSVADRVNLVNFTKEDSPTIIKKRYIDHYRNTKLFKVEYMNDNPINGELTEEVVEYLDENVEKHDLVIVGDFGHGFINKEIVKVVENKAKFLCANIQTNSANMGFNYFTKHNKLDFISLNENELRLGLHNRFGEIETLVEELVKLGKYKNCLLTRGKKGNVFISDSKIYKSPAIITNIKDTVGAGDAVFSLASLFNYAKVDPDHISQLANVVGAIASNIMGNKESVTKEAVIEMVSKVELGKI